MAMKPIKHYIRKGMYLQITELGDTIDAITVNGTIASDRSIMLILNVKRVNKNVKVFVLADRGLSEEKKQG